MGHKTSEYQLPAELLLEDENIHRILLSDNYADTEADFSVLPIDLDPDQIHEITARIGDYAEELAPSIDGVRTARKTEIRVLEMLADRASLGNDTQSDLTYGNCIKALRRHGLQGKLSAAILRVTRVSTI